MHRPIAAAATTASVALTPTLPDRPAPAGARYTCPMHPEVVRDRPGTCPICGMAFEPMTVTADDEADPELADMSRRFWISLALTVPLLLLSMGEMIPGLGLHSLSGGRLLVFIQLALASPVVLWGGWPFFERGWASLESRQLNMFTLIALGTGTAYLFSVVAAVAPGLFPDSFRDTARSRSTSRRRPSSRRWSCWARCSSCGRGGRRAAPSARSWASRRRPRGGCATTAPRRTCRSIASSPATGCASGRARRCRWTASCSKARAPWTSR